jgi:phage terminase large subunit
LTTINLPNGWVPRHYQRAAWNYLERGGKHAELFWHRRSGKDEIALHRTAVAAFERPATYWHMLPEASQARKAIWEAINPHSGKRRIDEAFPHEIRSVTRENEMMIRFKSGSTWQVLGSDNYNSLVGSPPAGCVFSEWAISNPSARAYLRPIFAENNGWQIYITTPRGRNHAHRTHMAARDDPDAFTQILRAADTGIITPEKLEAERLAYIADWGADQGQALFDQEYNCSFDAALLGAYYGSEFRVLEARGGIGNVPHDPAFPVHTAWDLGFSDDTGIWWYQVIAGEVRILEYRGWNGKDMQFYIEQIFGKKITNDEWKIRERAPIEYGGDVFDAKHRQAYRYGTFWLPHDARAKTLASGGRAIEETAWKAFGMENVRIVPGIGLQDGIQAVRAVLPLCWFDAEGTEDGVDFLKLYQREWNDTLKMFLDSPRHDFTSHAADGFRMLAISVREGRPVKEPELIRFPQHRTFNEIMARNKRRRLEGE